MKGDGTSALNAMSEGEVETIYNKLTNAKQINANMRNKLMRTNAKQINKCVDSG